MTKNWNWKKTNYDDYISQEPQNKYYRHSYNQKSTKINNYYNKKTQKYKNYQKNNIPSENQYSSNYVEIDDFQPFYPKNFKNTQNQFSDEYNKDEQYTFSQNKNNDFSNYENSINNNNNENNENYENNENNENNKIENQFQNKIDEEISTCPSENIKKQDKQEQNQKPKKFGIKNIPHPKRRKNYGSCYISGKKMLFFKPKKEEENFIKKERKLSISFAQNNFDSAKHSISTLNTSSSSYKEKDVLNEEKKSSNYIDNKIGEINNNDDNGHNDNKIIKNKFDENVNDIKNYNQQINPYYENTEILKVNVKLPNNHTVIFKLRRFDDLFLTIKLFCEINSIDEKFIKPLIIKSLCTINTIYQVYNSRIPSENIPILKTIKRINDNINDTEISNR